MKTLTITGTSRKTTGTKDAIATRKTGLVPCVLYGGKEQVFFNVDEKQFSKLLYTPDAYLVTLDIDGKQTGAIVREAQFNKVTDQLIHVDFLEAIPGKPITVKLPVVTHGSPVGVKMGGKLQVKLRRLTVIGMVADIPDHITLEVGHIKLGESILVKDMKNDKIKFLDPANSAILAVRTIREVALASATTTAVGAAPTTAGAAAPAPGAATPAAGAPAPAPAAPAKKEEKPAAAKK